jgi:hypothetical protein
MCRCVDCILQDKSHFKGCVVTVDRVVFGPLRWVRVSFCWSGSYCGSSNSPSCTDYSSCRCDCPSVFTFY